MLKRNQRACRVNIYIHCGLTTVRLRCFSNMRPKYIERTTAHQGGHMVDTWRTRCRGAAKTHRGQAFDSYYTGIDQTVSAKIGMNIWLSDTDKVRHDIKLHSRTHGGQGTDAVKADTRRTNGRHMADTYRTQGG